MKRILLIFFILGIFGCASLPKATVEMSNLLERQIDVLQKNNTDIINLYFDEKEKTILTFLDNQWYPAYLDMLFEEEYVQTIWEEAINSVDKRDRMEILKALTQIAQEKYIEQRNILLEPIRQGRKEMQALVISEYQKAKTMNSSITNNISQIQQIQEERTKYLSKIVDIEKIDVKMQESLLKIDSLFQSTQQWVNKYEDNKDKIDKVLNKLKK